MRPRDTGLPHPADGCPRCAGAFAVVPLSVEVAPGGEGVACWYRCPRCLHSWCCSWSAEGRAGDLHYYPDCHDEAACPCGCGLTLLRPARQVRLDGVTCWTTRAREEDFSQGGDAA